MFHRMPLANFGHSSYSSEIWNLEHFQPGWDSKSKNIGIEISLSYGKMKQNYTLSEESYQTTKYFSLLCVIFFFFL